MSDLKCGLHHPDHLMELIIEEEPCRDFTTPTKYYPNKDCYKCVHNPKNWGEQWQKQS